MNDNTKVITRPVHIRADPDVYLFLETFVYQKKQYDLYSYSERGVCDVVAVCSNNKNDYLYGRKHEHPALDRAKRILRTHGVEWSNLS